MVNVYETNEHAQHIMKRLGIDYKLAYPHSIGDCWSFWGCSNVPDVLPENFNIIKVTPEDFGLSSEDIKLLTNTQ